jgi:hypothetical protein
MPAYEKKFSEGQQAREREREREREKETLRKQEMCTKYFLCEFPRDCVLISREN